MFDPNYILAGICSKAYMCQKSIGRGGGGEEEEEYRHVNIDSGTPDRLMIAKCTPRTDDEYDNRAAITYVVYLA